MSKTFGLGLISALLLAIAGCEPQDGGPAPAGSADSRTNTAEAEPGANADPSRTDESFRRDPTDDPAEQADPLRRAPPSTEPPPAEEPPAPQL